ncbi:lipoyl synthase [Candidatus Bathyarchaeota archaeon]|nr:lipoyl synthase [Candidatus Bathyarchaeota archaeon]
MTEPASAGAQARKPDWLRVRFRRSEDYFKVVQTLRTLGLHTVCEEAHCPNSAECWGRRTATFMILGDLCTRSCRFCAVKSAREGRPVDPEEPARLAEAVKRLGVKYVVVTSVDRDDLPDGGAEHFARCVNAIKEASPESRVEVLIPDFNAELRPLRMVVQSRPDVIGHNVETVERLQGRLRDPKASYRTSLEVLEKIKRLNPSIHTKSSLMVGLGESQDEVLETLRDLRARRVEIVTIGQYLQPSRRHIPVAEYVRPEVFERFRLMAERLGFSHVYSGPLVRSSYHAAELFQA